MKRRIRLSESQLRNVIKESVYRILNEKVVSMDGEDINNEDAIDGEAKVWFNTNTKEIGDAKKFKPKTPGIWIKVTVEYFKKACNVEDTEEVIIIDKKGHVEHADDYTYSEMDLSDSDKQMIESFVSEGNASIKYFYY